MTLPLQFRAALPGETGAFNVTLLGVERWATRRHRHTLIRALPEGRDRSTSTQSRTQHLGFVSGLMHQQTLFSALPRLNLRSFVHCEHSHDQVNFGRARFARSRDVGWRDKFIASLLTWLSSYPALHKPFVLRLVVYHAEPSP